MEFFYEVGRYKMNFWVKIGNTVKQPTDIALRS